MKFRVADFSIDTALYRVSQAGVPVPVEPRVFDLLVYLIRHRDRVLSRDELFREVWGGREVSDATLGNHVMSARRALGDDGDRQHTIKTVRGRGYRFVAPVEAEGPPEVMAHSMPATAVLAAAMPALAAADPAPADAGAPAPGPQARRRWHLPALALGLLLLAVLARLGWDRFSQASTGHDDAPYLLVVPFGLSGDTPEAWDPQADQATRELIRTLRKISGLRVVPTASAFTFKGRKAREHIRAQLPEVRYVLDGVVSSAGEHQLHIAVELEDLASGRVLWSHDYAGRTDDTGLFAMPSAIASAVSGSLQVAIPAAERRALGELPTTNLRAYERYVAGRRELDLLSHASLPRAIAFFDEAIAMDPAFFDAYVARGDAYRQLFAYFEPPVAMLQPVVDSLASAQSVRPDSAEVWSSLGLTYVMAWRWNDAWIALNAARRRDPTLAQTELGFALYYAGLGEAERVRQALAAAERLDPLNAEMADWGNWALFMVGEHEAARAWAEQKMRQHPDIGPLFSGAGVAAYIRGDTARAVQLAEHGVALDGSPVALIMLAQAYGHGGQPERVAPLLAQATAAGTYTCPYESAAAWLSVGERERAFALLDEAVAKRSNCLMFLRSDPRWRPLRDDPRFAELLARVGLDDTALRSYPR